VPRIGTLARPATGASGRARLARPAAAIGATVARQPETAVLTGRELQPTADAAWTERTLRTLAGAMAISWSFRLSGYLTFSPWLAILVAALGLGGLLAIVAAWLPAGAGSGRRQRQADWLVLIAVLAGFALWSYFQVYIAPDYGTDEIAFDQYAAQLAMHGLDPYLHSMAAAFPLFHVSPNGYTFQLNGQPVTSLSYPALAFEAYLPILLLGITTQAATWMNIAAWAIGSVVLFTVLPRRLAPLAAIIASLDVYIGYAAGGVTDALFVPLLIGAAVRWDDFPGQRGPAAWRGPILLGLAMAVKQTPWLVAPFLVAGIVLEARRRQPAGSLRPAAICGLRYAGIALAAFLVPNLPYLVASPGAWMRGVLTPFSSHVVPAGQGLVGISLSMDAGGGSLGAYTIASVVVFLALLGCYLAAYPMLKPVTFLLPSIVLFFATRSFGSYLVMLIPAALAAAATTRQVSLAQCWRHWKLAAGAAAGASAAAITGALTVASPLGISILSVSTTGQLATVAQLRVAVTNESRQVLRPDFTIEEGTTMTAFWRQVGGPALLQPGQRVIDTIVAPSYFAMPSINDGFQVLAFSQDPATVSRTSAYVASLWRVVLQPATVNAPVAVGQRITVRAEVVNRLDEPMHVANLPVYLGQVIYAERGLQFSEAVVNGNPEGQTPVEARTSSDGVATFQVSSPVGGGNPVYFEANLVRSGTGYPYGYSPILAVRFGS
jgi:uncharacterized membrane protein